MEVVHFTLHETYFKRKYKKKQFPVPVLVSLGTQHCCAKLSSKKESIVGGLRINAIVMFIQVH
jgi:hypothetical protein